MSWNCRLPYLLLLVTVHQKASSLSNIDTTTAHSRRCTLTAWQDENIIIGSLLERRCPQQQLHEVFIGKNNEEIENGQKALQIQLPYLDETAEHGSSLASSIWPSSLAGAILLHCSTTLQKLILGKDILELGCGLGLGGLVAAASECSACIMTDNDEEIINKLQNVISTNEQNLGENYNKVKAECLDWRDSSQDNNNSDGVHNKIEQFDVGLGFDVAYYWYLLRPLMDTFSLRLRDQSSFLLVLGQANRESQCKGMAFSGNVQRDLPNILTRLLFFPLFVI